MQPFLQFRATADGGFIKCINLLRSRRCGNVRLSGQCGIRGRVQNFGQVCSSDALLLSQADQTILQTIEFHLCTQDILLTRGIGSVPGFGKLQQLFQQVPVRFDNLNRFLREREFVIRHFDVFDDL